MMVGRHNVGVLFHSSKGAVSPEAGTAATLLLTLLGVIALWLIRPGEHPLASRLLFLVRGLIFLDVAALLVAAGDLMLHTGRPPTVWWSALGWTTTVIAVILTLSWLMPRKLPSWLMPKKLRSRGGNDGGTGYATDAEGVSR
jgi:hypothetical protein